MANTFNFDGQFNSGNNSGTASASASGILSGPNNNNMGMGSGVINNRVGGDTTYRGSVIYSNSDISMPGNFNANAGSAGGNYGAKN